MTAVQLVAKYETGAEPGADRDEDEVFDAARDTSPAFAERGQVDVVLERDRQAEPVRKLSSEVTVLQTGDVHRELDRRPLHGARHSEHRGVDEPLLDAARVEQRCRQLLDRVERGRGGGLRELEVVPRAQFPAHVAHRAADEARAEVEAQNERRLRRRLVEPCPVARPVASVLRLAHEPGLEERLERERDRRLRNAHAA